MPIELTAKVEKRIQLKSVSLFAKICDQGSYTYKDVDGEIIKDADGGYVPGFFPGQNFGDYLDLEIDLETGQILNWEAPSAEQLEEAMKGDE